MKHHLLFLTATVVLGSCAGKQSSTTADDNRQWLDNAIEVSASQLLAAAERFDSTMLFPRSLKTDYSLEELTTQLEVPVDSFKPEIELLKHPSANDYRKPYLVGYDDWTSGFFPGSLWYAYELTGNEELKNQAVKYTNRLLPVSYLTNTHDLGFMVNCSYGNAMRLAPNDTIQEVMVRTAQNLAVRYDDGIGCIRSWDFGPWNYPVIIDNMMNLDLLFKASAMSGDSTLTAIARRHADTTLRHHFRDDNTCFHVVSYNNDGSPERRQTFQGKADDSAWARGQGWALYGYTEMFRNTGDRKYLAQAQKVADMVMDRNNTEDAIPLWDFDAIAGENTPRDASAAAVIASGMLELSEYAENGDKYFNYAERILKSLASATYLAPEGANENFILKHSTGSLPHGSEIDTPLNYADYYFLEGLVRYRNLVK